MSGGVSNSSILIKRSTATGRPSSLKSGELAYSYLSNTIFIGTSDGTSTLNVGGQYYTSQLDSATPLNVANTIVRRDAAGNSYFGNVVVSGFITGTIQGTSNNATALASPQNFGISGGDITASNIAFNGTSAVILSASLNNVSGLSGGTVGSNTSIPVITYGANGRILNVSSVTVSANYQPAFDWANSAYNAANSSSNTAFSAYARANAAYNQANSAYSLATTAESDAQTGITNAAQAYSAACTAQQLAQSAYTAQNTTASFANSAFGQANSAAVFANGAFASANAVQFTITDGTHSNTFYRSGTLTVTGTTGVTAVASANTLTFGTDNTVLRSNTTSGIGATQNINTSLSITGNLTTGNIIPSSAYMSIGTFANPVQELYVSSNSLNVGGISLSNTGSVLTIGGGVTDLAVSTSFGPLSNIASVANTGYNFVNTGGTVNGNVNIVGNLVVRGTTTQVDTTTETTTAGTIGLAANNTGDVIDIGLYGTYVNGTTKLTGLVRGPGTSNYYLFNNINATELSGNNIPSADFTAANSATLYANVVSYQTSSSGQATFGSVVSNTAIAVSSGGTGAATFSAGQILVGNGTGALQVLANTGTAGTYGNANTIAVTTTDAYGRVSGVTNTAISGLTVTQGGTGASSFSAGQIVIGNGSGALQVLANTGTAGTYGNANTIAVTTTDAYGRVSGITATPIAITSGQITNTTGNTGTSVVLSASPTLTGTTQVATIVAAVANASSANITTANVGTLYANTVSVGGGLTYTASGLFAGFSSNANNYQQVVIENANTGTQASADFIVSNGISTDGAFYGDFGMNGQNFSGSGSLNTANTVYLYAANVDLAIGTTTSNAIHFVVNNGTTDAATIASNGMFSLATALGTAYGGTGASSFTSDGIIYGNGGGALQATVAAGTSDQAYTNQVLTVTNSGVPVWSSAVDGGTF